jgi:L-threonylcarbamoyladenylate synthase
MPVILDWLAASTPDDLIRQTVQTLYDGHLVLLPSEIGYVLAANPATFADERPTIFPSTIPLTRYEGFFDANEFLKYYPQQTPTERAFLQRLWPSGTAVVHGDSPYPAWMPAHSVLGTILGLISPLALFEMNGGQPLEWSTLGEAVQLIVNVGEIPTQSLTQVTLNDRHWQIVQQGIVSKEHIRERLTRKIVFVCTGNTCRSPMAEVVFKHRLAERLGCTVAELPLRGYSICSAGVSTSDGHPASPEAVEILGEWGMDLSPHRSQMALAELIAGADDVIAMTRSHLLTILSKYPVLSGSFRLLCGPDGDLDDPIGAGPEVYRVCAEMVRQHVERLITEMGLS